MTDPPARPVRLVYDDRMTRRADVALFFVLACALTWLADLPLALAGLQGTTPAAYALPLTGLGAFGPTLAALLIAGPRGELRDVFGRWRTSFKWISLALLTPAALHLPATVIEVALGGRPAQWFYPPDRPEYLAAMLVFSIGEEFGWRGFAYPRLTRLHGPVLASLIVGAVWGLWHLGMWITPSHGWPALSTVVLGIFELALMSVVFAWVFERGGRSMAVAFAMHAGGHLDNVSRAPASELRLQALRMAVLVLAAALAARALARADRAHDQR